MPDNQQHTCPSCGAPLRVEEQHWPHRDEVLYLITCDSGSDACHLAGFTLSAWDMQDFHEAYARGEYGHYDAAARDTRIALAKRGYLKR